MQRIAVWILGVMTISTSLFAQAASDTALLAAPANLREGATIITWKPDYTYETVKKGTNRLVCFDSSGMPGQQPFSVECTSIANLDRVAQNLKFEAEPDRASQLHPVGRDPLRMLAGIGVARFHGITERPHRGPVGPPELLRAGSLLLEHLAQIGGIAFKLPLSGRSLLLRALKACTEERNCFLTGTGAQIVTIGARQRST